MNGEAPYLVVQVSAGDSEAAWAIAQTSVARKLAACAQVFPIRSCYEWEGKVVQDDEYLVLLKTRAEAYDRLAACIRELHRYEVPEVIALPIVRGSDSYLRWVDEVVGGGEPQSQP
ncbi:MAG: divalent-cation tolerance protein CutA [Chloroflexaceae bacterium]|nr:divalent-cation tolerance protein CutA [Chloroflexaceae bacterium]